jgi:hypothetical protein
LSLALLTVLLAAPVHAACTFGASNETTLQGVFDTVLGSGVLSAANDCLPDSADAVWTAPGQVVATIIIEIAGFSGSNSFGIYDPSHPSQQATVFTGADGMGTSATVQLVTNAGGAYDVLIDSVLATTFASSSFGFFLHTPQNNTFFSQSALNIDSADHMYSYQGNGHPFIAGPLDHTDFTTSMYLLAFEDLLMAQSDRDYQDFVAAVSSASPIPLPAGIWLLGSMLVMFESLRRARFAPLVAGG